MKKTVALVSGLAMALGLSAVNAADLMKLTAAEMDGVTAGTGGTAFQFYKNIDVNKDVYVTVDKYVQSVAVVYGNLAEAEAIAEAWGNNTMAQTLTVSVTTDYNSVAASESTSATGVSLCGYPC